MEVLSMWFFSNYQALFCCLLIIIFSATLSFLELYRHDAFKDRILEVLKIKWAWFSILMNCSINVFIFFFVLHFDLIPVQEEIHMYVAALAIGFGFPALFKRRFKIAKADFGMFSKKNATIDLGKIYNHLQTFFKAQIENDLSDNRTEICDRILSKYDNLTTLYDMALRLGNGEHIEKHKKYLDSIRAKKGYSDDFKKHSIASFIFYNSTARYIKKILKD